MMAMVRDGGGWYGGGAAANYSATSGIANYAAGGGGGSGYVWTSSTASSAPSGYSVPTKYYLTDAGTYGSGEEGFITNPNTGNNGYARITLVAKGTNVTATRWIGIEGLKNSGKLTGTFNYRGKTITETDTANITITHNGE